MAHLVDKRHHRVHDKDGERHALRICTEITDKHGDDTYTYSEDYATPVAHRRSHIVGSHEDGSEKETSGEKVEYRVGVDFRIDEPEDSGEHDHGCPDRQSDVRSDDPAGKQIYKTYQKGDGRELSGRTTDIEEESLEIVHAFKSCNASFLGVAPV